MNPCLRPACLSDITENDPSFALSLSDQLRKVFFHIKRLYDAEWRKRGFLRSP